VSSRAGCAHAITCVACERAHASVEAPFHNLESDQFADLLVSIWVSERVLRLVMEWS
jgi:hypothetical protein